MILRATALAIACLSIAPACAEVLTRAVRIIGPQQPGAEPARPDSGPGQQAPESPPLANKADLRLTIAPSANARVGAKMSYRVSAKSSGYLILLDVDAQGKVIQIFPNFLSLAKNDGKPTETNRISPNAPVVIPAPGSTTYEFVATPPLGIGMTLAIFSETPLEMVDLPDVPADMAGKPAAAEFLRQAADGLKIVASDASAGFQSPKFSYAAQFYVIE
jgi:hypothetical protein